MRHSATMLAVLVLVVAASAAQDRVIVMESGSYPTTQSAQAAWRPSEAGSPPVKVVAGSLAMPCNFASNPAWRVSWDRSGKWDLAGCQSIRIELIVDRDRPAQMILYFRSGEGWYGRSFAAPPGRSAIDIPRQRFGSEGKPGGWDRIEAIRISIQNDEPEDRVIRLISLTAIQRVGRIAIYRNDVGVKSESGVPQYVQETSDRLTRLGLAHEIFGDEEVAGGKLAGQAVVIMPLNPVLPKPAAAAIEKFVASGGKVIAFYLLPGPLEKLLGLKTRGAIQGNDRLFAMSFRPAPRTTTQPEMRVEQQSWLARRVAPVEGTTVRGWWIDKAGTRSDEPTITSNAAGFFVGHVFTQTDESAKDRLMQEMIGELWPGMWESVYRARLATLGKVAGFGGVEELENAILARSGDAYSLDLTRVKSPIEWARRFADAGKFAEAAGQLADAQRDLLAAYASSIQPKAGEFRGVWCHSPHGAGSIGWDDAMKKLADAGFNAVLPNMLWGGSAAFDSKVLPRGTDIKRDLLADCLAAAKKNVIAVHVWKVNWNLWYNCPPPFKAQLRKEGRLQADPSGKEIDWLCPSNPANQKLELDSLVDLATRYEIAGIHFDYIRYPGDGGCYCAGCRQRFEERIGRKGARWPADVVAGGLLLEEFRQFRRDNITQLVAAVSEQARKVRPGIKISAAVFWHWPSARNSVGQDWKVWIEKGYLDFVCPMQYTDNAAVFAGQCRQTTGWASGRMPVMPGIGATLGLAPDGTLQQVLAARKQSGCGGFVLFNFEPNLLEHLALLRLGATRK